MPSSDLRGFQEHQVTDILFFEVLEVETVEAAVVEKVFSEMRIPALYDQGQEMIQVVGLRF
jgi:hypothetical protein